jgi:hypothetical protein
MDLPNALVYIIIAILAVILIIVLVRVLVGVALFMIAPTGLETFASFTISEVKHINHMLI